MFIWIQLYSVYLTLAFFRFYKCYHSEPLSLPTVSCTKSPHNRCHLWNHKTIRKRHCGYRSLEAGHSFLFLYYDRELLVLGIALMPAINFGVSTFPVVANVWCELKILKKLLNLYCICADAYIIEMVNCYKTYQNSVSINNSCNKLMHHVNNYITCILWKCTILKSMCVIVIMIPFHKPSTKIYLLHYCKKIWFLYQKTTSL